MHSMTFRIMGVDILGLFPPVSGQQKFLLVPINYFTKWMEAEPLARITKSRVIDFVWKVIIYHFKVLQVLITDNGR